MFYSQNACVVEVGRKGWVLNVESFQTPLFMALETLPESIDLSALEVGSLLQVDVDITPIGQYEVSYARDLRRQSVDRAYQQLAKQNLIRFLDLALERGFVFIPPRGFSRYPQRRLPQFHYDKDRHGFAIELIPLDMVVTPQNAPRRPTFIGAQSSVYQLITDVCGKRTNYREEEESE